MCCVQKSKGLFKDWYRKRIHNIGLAGKIALWYVLFMLLTVAVLSAMTVMTNRQALFKEKKLTLLSAAQHITAILDQQGEGQSTDNNDQEALNGNVPQGMTVQLTNPQGQIIQKVGVLKSLPVAENVEPELRVVAGRDVYYLAQPVLNDAKIVGYLQAAIGLEDIELAERVLLQQFLIVGGTALLLALAGGLLLARRVLRPLETLNKEIDGLSASNLGRRLPVSGNGDEIDRLSQSFNQMMARLENSFRQQKQFAGNASHELRTPIMVIHGHADILVRWGAEKPEVVRESASEIIKECIFMTRLVQNLLTLAREEVQLNVSEVHISQLMLESTEEFPFLGSYKVDYQIEPGVIVQGDLVFLKQVIRILLENIGKYVPAGAHVVLTLQKMPDKVRLIFEDNGPGIPEEALEAVFERFYRVDEARSRRVPGHGLGLSIAKRFVELHHGRIWVENVLPHGASFIVELPLV